jgi:phosphocarrier protein
MKEFQYTLKDPNGLHARPAGLLVREAQALSDEITLICGKKEANLKKLLAVMGLGVKGGDTVTVRIVGNDEEASAARLLAAMEKIV